MPNRPPPPSQSQPANNQIPPVNHPPAAPTGNAQPTIGVSSSRQWTPEQQDAITSLNTSLLVSAAAGSGKTAVLAERCVRLVCDKPRCNISSLLVVTFTDTAASEMKSRIESALRDRLATTPHDTHLRRQFALLDHIHCSTLHSFCNRLLRQHFSHLGLDPDFRIMDADEATLLRLEIVRDLFADSYDRKDSMPFCRFIDAYGGSRDDESLMSLVIDTHAMLSSLVDPLTWIDRSLARITHAAQKPLEASELGLEFLAIVRSRLADLHQDTHAAIAAISRIKGFDSYVAYLQSLSSTLARWTTTLEQNGYDALVSQVAQTNLDRLPSIRANTPGKEAAHQIVSTIQKQFKQGPFINSLRFTSQELQDGLRSIAPHAKVFLDLVLDFDRRFRKQKKSLRALDFSDLERFTLQLLSEGNEKGKQPQQLRPSPIARLLHKQFHHVLVDEYQDINELQDAILSLASHECLAPDLPPNLFAVGDVKQSIYRFRLAEPQRFLTRADHYRLPNPVGRLIHLQNNFRSRGPLLDALNQLFERLMVGDATEITYDETHRLRPSASFPTADKTTPSFTGSPIELHFLPAAIDTDENDGSEILELERTEREALLVARRIEDLLGRHGHPRMNVADRQPGRPIQLRPIECRDIVILLRATRYHADAYADILRRHQIPVYNAGGSGYFDSTEIHDVLALLRLLDNQQQDIPMASVLRSPLAGLPSPDDALAQIRLASPQSPLAANPTPLPFATAVMQYAADKDDPIAAAIRSFLKRLAHWRTLASHRPVADLIWTIYEDTGLLTFCSGLPNGQQRCANLIHLYERARQFGTFSRQGLYRFIRFLETLKEETDPAPPSELSEAENVVRIMSVHKSKGLEFPVVILPSLGKRINFQSCNGNIVADRHAFLGLSAIDERKQIRYPSLASTIIAERLRQQTLAEELRILYVAMTRAKEHLILVGATNPKNPLAWSQKYASHIGPLPADTILSAKNALDWLGPLAVPLSKPQPPYIQNHNHPQEEIQEWLTPPAARRDAPADVSSFAQLNPLTPTPSPNPIASDVIARLQYQYPHQPFTTLQAATSVANLTKQTTQAASPTLQPSAVPPLENQKSTIENLLRLPTFLQDSPAPLSPTQRGEAVHLFLRHLDFANNDLQFQLASFLDRRLLTTAQSQSIDLAQVAWFLATTVGQLLQQHARSLLRELPLTCSLPPEQFNAPPSSDPLDRVMLRGRIDLLLPDTRGFVLIDYKTDTIPPRFVAHRAEQYRPQIRFYRAAIEKITRRAVHTAHLVFLSPRQIVAL